MIITFEELKAHRKSVALVDGCFDPLHKGHIEYFQQAAGLGLSLLCSVASDAYVRTKHEPLLPEAHRAAILDVNENIAFTLINDRSTAEVLAELQPRYYVKGRDWEGRLPEAETEACRRFDIEVVYLDTVTDSSARILCDYVSRSWPRPDFKKQVETFEELVVSQKPVAAEHYDTEYFHSEWRDDNNSYQLETRRRIEGRNPQIIKDVFQPERVLDLGCGPGALMFLLNELGIYTEGIDFSQSSKDLAPAAVRDRIVVGEVTDPLVPENGYDLVICREVLEHLTILQVRRTVQNMVRSTSKFIYCTTRFHPDPDSLLSVTTQFDVDPSHITLMTKDMLRVLFILEGCRSRPDLEAKMDWLGKGRVLVLEKIPQAA